MSSSSPFPETAFPALDPGQFQPIQRVEPVPTKGFVGARAFRANALNHTATGFWQSIALDTLNYDPHNLFTATGDFKIPTGLAGYWAIMGAVGWAASASTFSLAAGIYINTTIATQNFGAREGENDILIQPVHEVAYLNSGDSVILYGYQTSVGNFAYSVGGGAETWLSLHYLGTTAGQP